MVTPGKLLKAFKVMVFVKDTLSNIVPRAVTRRLDVEMVQSKLGSWSKYVANEVNLHRGGQHDEHRHFGMTYCVWSVMTSVPCAA